MIANHTHHLEKATSLDGCRLQLARERHPAALPVGVGNGCERRRQQRAPTRTLSPTHFSIALINSALLGVFKHLVRLRDFLEAASRLGHIVGVAVWVPLQRKLAVPEKAGRGG